MLKPEQDTTLRKDAHVEAAIPCVCRTHYVRVELRPSFLATIVVRVVAIFSATSRDRAPAFQITAFQITYIRAARVTIICIYRWPGDVNQTIQRQTEKELGLVESPLLKMEPRDSARFLAATQPGKCTGSRPTSVGLLEAPSCPLFEGFLVLLGSFRALELLSQGFRV